MPDRRTPPEGYPLLGRTVTRELLDRVETEVKDVKVRIANVEIQNATQSVKLDVIDKRTASMEAALVQDRTKRNSDRPPTFAENELAKDAAVRRRIIIAVGMAVAGGLGYLLHHLT